MKMKKKMKKNKVITNWEKIDIEKKMHEFEEIITHSDYKELLVFRELLDKEIRLSEVAQKEGFE